MIIFEDKKKYEAAQKRGDKSVQKPADKNTLKVTIQKAIPSKTHMAMVELMEKKHLKHVVSCNVDGLHRKSGIPADNLSELHGNTNLELCMKCEREHMRDFRVRSATKVKEHKTGRKCDTVGCGGDLKDTIINFGEDYNEGIYDVAFHNCQIADLCIAMGSSLRVSPICQKTAQAGGNLIICNLQKTPLDKYATLCIHAKCDDIMELLMKKLGYEIPAWQMKRRLNVALAKDVKELQVKGVDANGAVYSLFKEVKVTLPGDVATKSILK